MACGQSEVAHWSFHLGELDSPDVAALLDLHFAAMRSSSPADACHVLPRDELHSADIRFWSLREEGRLLCVGALKRLAADHGELKSMRATSEALGRGAGRAMLDHLLEDARGQGFDRVSLETGSTEPFVPALRLYAAEGFVPCEPFGQYCDTPFTRFMTRTL